MAIQHVGNTRDGNYTPICYVDDKSIAIRGGILAGNILPKGERLKDGDLIITRHPAEISHGDFDIPLHDGYFTKGVYPAAHFNGQQVEITKEEACGTIFMSGMDPLEARKWVGIDE